MKKISLLLILAGFVSSGLFCFEAIPTSQLLLSYLENDNALKENAINAQKAQLNLDSSKINNGFDVTLSTGNITIRTTESGTSISVKPTVQALIPQASNLKITASSSFDYKADDSEFTDTKINASIDIVSSASLSRKIALLKAQRSLDEACRKLRNQAVNTEKAFYTELKTLLSSTNSLINLEKNLYTNKIDFEKIKAQGYSTGSSTYRLAQMRVLSGEHDIENSKRTLIHSYIVFYKKCGYDISLEDNADFFDLVPSDIVEIEPLDIHSFNPESYVEIEAAVWNNTINSMQRKTEKNFTLTANGGVTFNNSVTNSNTIDFGLSSKLGGVNLGAGLSMPVSENPMPALTFSASLNPNTFRQNSISKKLQTLNEEQELLAIETARTNFATKVVDCEQSLSNIIWTKKTDEESYEMYSSLEKDLAKWYAQGIISESEYYSAKINAQSYSVKKIMDNIDFIIYNDNLVIMFVEENLEK